MINRHNRQSRQSRQIKEVDQMPSAIKVICLDTGHIYDSVGEAARAAGITVSGMTRALQRGSKCSGCYYAALPDSWDITGDQIDIWCKAKRMDIIIKNAERKPRRSKS